MSLIPAGIMGIETGIWLVGAAGMLGRQMAGEFASRGWAFFASDRNEPYLEQDEPRPLSRYGWSKLQGELRLASCLEHHFLLRISWLYGVHGPNFVHTMLREELGFRIRPWRSNLEDFFAEKARQASRQVPDKGQA